MNKEVVVILIMSILLISELTIFGMNRNLLTQPFANSLVSEATATQENQSVSNIGYVRYTLDLVCNKLFNGFACV